MVFGMMTGLAMTAGARERSMPRWGRHSCLRGFWQTGMSTPPLRPAMNQKGGMMGKTIFFLASLVMSCAAFCQADKLALVVEPSSLPSTSESVFIRVAFTNARSSTLTIPEPSIEKNLAIRVFDDKNEEIAGSYPHSYFDEDDQTEKVPAKYISLKPHAMLEMVPIDIFKTVSPSFLINPGQTVRVKVTYTFAEADYEAQATLKIPAHDLEIKDEYISEEKALALAEQHILEVYGSLDVINGFTSSVKCINGKYRVMYLAPPKSRPPGWRGRTLNVLVHIDALTGKILYATRDG